MAERVRPAPVPWWVTLFNRMARPLLATSMPMGPNALITVRGRQSGRPRTTPVTVVELSDRRWVLGVYGDVNWVRNLRAARTATISARRRSEAVTVVSSYFSSGRRRQASTGGMSG